MSISKDEDLELYLKRKPNSCFVSNYFDTYLKAWQANVDRQLDFNEYKAVTYMCQYFSKTEDQCSQAMKQAAKEAFENNMHHHDTMKTIAKAYLSSRECSVQEAVCHILSELKLRRIFPAMYFVNTNLPKERVQILLLERERSELRGDSPNILKKSNIKRYMERPNAAFCYAEYKRLSLCRFENKSTKTCEYRPDELDENHNECSYRKKTFFFQRYCLFQR